MMIDDRVVVLSTSKDDDVNHVYKYSCSGLVYKDSCRVLSIHTRVYSVATKQTSVEGTMILCSDWSLLDRHFLYCLTVASTEDRKKGLISRGSSELCVWFSGFGKSERHSFLAVPCMCVCVCAFVCVRGFR